MSRQTWKKGNLYISYGNPSITPYYDSGGTERHVNNMSDVMYFYYDITILQDAKTLFNASAYDFPKVQNLHLYIDQIMNYDMSKSYLLEDYKNGGFHRKVNYSQVTLGDGFDFDIEYFYKIERYDYSVEDSAKKTPNEWTEYVLTIGQMEVCKKYGGANREEYGKSITIKYLTPEDLINLKNTATKFCEKAIHYHNHHVIQA